MALPYLPAKIKDFPPIYDAVKDAVDKITTDMPKTLRNSVPTITTALDMNTFTTPGTHAWASPTIPTNWPANTGAIAGLIENIAIEGVGIIQRVISVNTIFVHVRKGAYNMAAGGFTWTTWRQL